MHIASAPAELEPVSFITMSSTFSAISQSVSHIVPNSDECCNLSINAMKISWNSEKKQVGKNASVWNAGRGRPSTLSIPLCFEQTKS